MNHIHITFIILTSLFIISCSSDETSSTSITATIDGTDYVFSGCGTLTTNGYEYEISCNHISGGEAKRLNLSKAFDINGGAIGVNLTDIPDSSLLDSSYGIHYECDDNAVTYACATGTPVYDAPTTTISLTDVVVNLSWNRTDEGVGTPVMGVASHTISVSVDVSTIPGFQ